MKSLHHSVEEYNHFSKFSPNFISTRKIQLYKAENGQYSWRIVASNGKIIAIAGEQFKGKLYAFKSAVKYFPYHEIENLIP